MNQDNEIKRATAVEILKMLQEDIIEPFELAATGKDPRGSLKEALEKFQQKIAAKYTYKKK